MRQRSTTKRLARGGRPTRRFDIVEVACLCLFAAVLGAAGLRWHLGPPENAWLKAAYGRHHWSHGPEEWIVRDFFQDRRDGVFLDVGSADARRNSNTYYLESELGWSGVAVDALSEYGPSYRQYRPRTQFFALFAGDTSDSEATFHVSQQVIQASSAVRDFTTTMAGPNVGVRQVPTITLNDLLQQAKIDRIDFLSMDIELSEPQALAPFDLARYRPALVCVEAHQPIKQWLIDYFASHSYGVVGKYLYADKENLWFKPVSN